MKSSTVSLLNRTSILLAATMVISPLFSPETVGQTLNTPANKTQPAQTIKSVNGTTASLGQTSNGCELYLEQFNTDNERLVIVKNGERNVFPTLEEAEIDRGPRMDAIRDTIATAERDNMESWFNNNYIAGKPVPQKQYQWRLKAHSLLAVTIYQMNREAILTGNSDAPSVYLQRYMIGHARRVLNTSLTQADRLQSTIRLVYHGFADLQFTDQKKLDHYIEASEKSDYLLDYKLRANAFDRAQYCTDQSSKGAPKFTVDPEGVGKAMMMDCVGEDNLKDTIHFYKNSNRIGYNNITRALEAARQSSVRYAPPK